MHDTAYEMREAAEFHEQMMAADKLPLSERKENCVRFHEDMRDPDLIAERISWLLEGNYGYGAMQAAKRTLANKRSNRAAILTHLVGSLEWQCPARLAASAWKKLSQDEKTALDSAIKHVIKEHGG